MGFVMWIVVWMIVGALAVASIPVLVVGTWYVVMTLILGVADAGIWILDLGSRMIRGRENRPASMPMPTSEYIDANGKKAPVSTLTARIPVNRPVTL
jgi:hypothetical protein